jgi:hypothetical protein
MPLVDVVALHGNWRWNYNTRRRAASATGSAPLRHCRTGGLGFDNTGPSEIEKVIRSRRCLESRQHARLCCPLGHPTV